MVSVVGVPAGRQSIEVIIEVATIHLLIARHGRIRTARVLHHPSRGGSRQVDLHHLIGPLTVMPSHCGTPPARRIGGEAVPRVDVLRVLPYRERCNGTSGVRNPVHLRRIWNLIKRVSRGHGLPPLRRTVGAGARRRCRWARRRRAGKQLGRDADVRRANRQLGKPHVHQPLRGIQSAVVDVNMKRTQ